MIREHLPPPVRRAARWAKQQIRPRGIILMYHRIAEEEIDPWRLCVSPNNFRQQLEALGHGRVRVMQLSDLAVSLRSGVVPRRSIAITFDDGYADNLENARPMLSQFGMPATVFAASGTLGSNEEFWWDALERIFLSPSELPPVLEMEISGERKSWWLGEDALWTEHDARQYSSWRPYHAPQTQRQKLYQELRNAVMVVTSAERRRIIDELLVWAGIPKTARPNRRLLDETGLRCLVADDLVQIGGHSISHPELAALSAADQEHELRASKNRLEQILGREITALAYPHGSCSPETKRLAREAGYTFACGTKRTAVERGADIYQLPRIGVHNLSGAEFKELLGEFLEM